MRNITFRPMLAAKQPSDFTIDQFYAELRFPVWATPKLDGIRCVTRDLPRPPGYTCEALGRSLKPIPNEYINAKIGTECIPGLDGELITYNEDLFSAPVPRPFNSIQSDVMTFGKMPNFRFHVFDSCIESNERIPYHRRLEILYGLTLPPFVQVIRHTEINNLEELIAYESAQVEAGYEGICFRHPSGPYKYGRSTLREGWLIKMKRMITEEAGIIGTYEEMANNNPMSLDERGYAERSSHKANMVGKGRLGGLIVARKGESQFRIGSGFTADQRQTLWDCRDTLVGKTVTFKHQPYGSKDHPRIPIFVGFRDPVDM